MTYPCRGACAVSAVGALPLGVPLLREVLARGGLLCLCGGLLFPCGGLLALRALLGARHGALPLHSLCAPGSRAVAATELQRSRAVCCVFLAQAQAAAPVLVLPSAAYAPTARQRPCKSSPSPHFLSACGPIGARPWLCRGVGHRHEKSSLQHAALFIYSEAPYCASILPSADLVTTILCARSTPRRGGSGLLEHQRDGLHSLAHAHFVREYAAEDLYILYIICYM